MCSPGTRNGGRGVLYCTVCEMDRLALPSPVAAAPSLVAAVLLSSQESLFVPLVLFSVVVSAVLSGPYPLLYSRLAELGLLSPAIAIDV